MGNYSLFVAQCQQTSQAKSGVSFGFGVDKAVDMSATGLGVGDVDMLITRQG